MKQLITITLILVVAMTSCKKATDQLSENYLQNVQAGLKDSTINSDFTQLDFSRAILSKVDSVQLYLLRIPFKGHNLRNDFVILKTSQSGQIQLGKFVHLEGNVSEYGEGVVKRRKFDGNITISSLNRQETLSSAVKDGFIEAYHKQNTALKTSVLQAPDVMPEIIVIAYVSSGGISFSDWVWLQSFFTNSGGGGSWGGYYGSLDGGSGGSYGGGGNSGGSTGGGPTGGGGGISQEPPIMIDLEVQDENPTIDLQKFINCFNAIPDAGATCSIEIFADIPVDTDPNKLFDFTSGSPGHTFVNIRKSNGSQSVSQNIGFYPKTGWKTVLTNAPIDGKFVDNSNHEFNAGLKMSLTPADLTSTLTEILYLKNSKYDIDNYNCTDWALSVFNKTRTNKLEIPLYDIPGNVPSTGTSTPQGLYNKLKQMKTANGPEAANINIDILKGWAGNSTGPCN